MGKNEIKVFLEYGQQTQSGMIFKNVFGCITK